MHCNGLTVRLPTLKLFERFIGKLATIRKLSKFAGFTMHQIYLIAVIKFIVILTQRNPSQIINAKDDAILSVLLDKR